MDISTFLKRHDGNHQMETVYKEPIVLQYIYSTVHLVTTLTQQHI